MTGTLSESLNVIGEQSLRERGAKICEKENNNNNEKRNFQIQYVPPSLSGHKINPSLPRSEHEVTSGNYLITSR